MENDESFRVQVLIVFNKLISNILRRAFSVLVFMLKQTGLPKSCSFHSSSAAANKSGHSPVNCDASIHVSALPKCPPASCHSARPTP